MKALRIKVLAATFVVAAGALAWSKYTDAPEPTKDSPEPLRSEVTMTTSTVTATSFAADPSFEVEYRDIKSDLSTVREEKAELDELRAELKADRKADREMEVIVTKKEIAKTKADIRHAKAYYKADKKDLKRDYRLAIKGRRDITAEHRKELCEAKKELRRDMRQGNSAALVPDAAEVALHMEAHEDSKLALRELKENKDDDFYAIRKEARTSNVYYASYDDVNRRDRRSAMYRGSEYGGTYATYGDGTYIGTTYAQDGSVYTGTWDME